MKIIAAAGTGFIGKALVRRLLEEGHSVVVLSRNPSKVESKHQSLIVDHWDGTHVDTWVKHIDGSDVVINLAGEIIAGKRWSQRQKEIILKSRVDSTKALVSAIATSPNKPSLLINFSGVGFYGSVFSGDVPESFPHGDDFLAQVCERWENAALEAEKFGVRVVTPRLGVVLAEDGGALKRLILPFKLYTGGYLGSGVQWFPWIHRDDLIEALLFIINRQHLRGAINVTAPESVTMKTFCETLGKVLRSPSWTFVPSIVLRLMLGEMANMLLTGQRAVPKKLIDSGFVFRYPTLERALTSLFQK